MCCFSKQSEACAHFSPVMSSLVALYGSLKHTHTRTLFLVFSYYAVFRAFLPFQQISLILLLPLLLFISLSLLLRTLTLALILSHHPLLLLLFSGPVISLAELLCPI